MNAECLRIADQLRRAFTGDPWHGDSLRKLLDGITVQQASSRPVASAHTIWELVLHIEIWTRAALESTQGVPMPKLYGTEKDWPVAADASPEAYAGAVLFKTSEQLAQAIEKFGDERLQETVPGRKYDFYYLFHGIVQHSLYHGGQIALLKKA
ncbi:MAG TPA: DinB family protein [Candidatus Angelobacter sp.]|nr:DinB family protein [Candidatus Angelobacter sp.]